MFLTYPQCHEAGRKLRILHLAHPDQGVQEDLERHVRLVRVDLREYDVRRLAVLEGVDMTGQAQVRIDQNLEELAIVEQLLVQPVAERRVVLKDLPQLALRLCELHLAVRGHRTVHGFRHSVSGQFWRVNGEGVRHGNGVGLLAVLSQGLVLQHANVDLLCVGGRICRERESPILGRLPRHMLDVPPEVDLLRLGGHGHRELVRDALGQAFVR